MRRNVLTLVYVALAASIATGLSAVGCGGGDDTSVTPPIPSDQTDAGATGGSNDGGGAAGKAGGAGKSGGSTTGGSSGTHGGSGGSAGAEPKDAGFDVDTTDCAVVPPMDPSTFGAPCCDAGAAHCIPTNDVNPAVLSYFASCDQTNGSAGICVGDTQISQGSAYVPKSCAFAMPGDAVCLSACIPAVTNDPASALLQQKTCATGELCVPCINPLTHQPTGACDLPPACTGSDAGTDGGGGSGGSGGSNDDAGSGCPYTGPPIFDPSTLPACAPACDGAHCLPSALVPDAQKALLSMCASSNGPGYCAPDELIASGGEGLPPTCTSVAGAEGRCLSTCIPQVAAQAAVLPQSTCADGHLCAPCFNPFADDPTMPTGACSVACDAPKSPPTEIMCPYTGDPVVDPTKFDPCAPACDGAHCVPDILIPTALQAQLDVCPGGHCAPDSLTVAGGKGVPPTCTSVAGAEGRCLSMCLPAVASQLDVLPQSTCAADERCAPCYDPFATDPTMPTGACSLACDMPAQPPTEVMCPYSGPALIDPTTFPDCSPACGGAHCLPAELVPMAEQSQLTPCSGGFCTPDDIIASGGKSVPASCDPFPGSGDEGRCLSTCLPAIEMQASQLSQSSCMSGQLCAPCYDPFSGADTGACRTSCDAPKNPEFTFPLCCDYMGQKQGTCVPGAELTDAQKANLQADVCPSNAAAYSCVPDEYLPTATAPIQTCKNLVLGAGACVSKCAKLPATSVILTQDGCAANHVCVPCSLANTTPGCM